LILCAVELIINCHLLDIGTGQTGGEPKIAGDMTFMLQLEGAISKPSK